MTAAVERTTLGRAHSVGPQVHCHIYMLTFIMRACMRNYTIHETQ